MGKKGNSERKARKTSRLAEQVMSMMDDPQDIQLDIEDAIRLKAEQEKTSLELIYGPPGVPKDAAWPRDGKRVVDLLGRPLKDNIVPILANKPGGPVVTTTKVPNDRRVTLMRDHTLDYPDLFLEVFVAGDKYEEAAFAQMFSRARCQRAKSVLEADIVIFTGGVDVDPALYGEEAHKSVRFNEGRDTDDINLFLLCQEHGIPMFGVCRGAQFLHVMMGGKLYQDVDNHYGDHPIYDRINKRMIDKVSSVHHQMVIENNDMEILATASVAKERWKNPNDSVVGQGMDVEAFYYRSHCIIGVQGHPEYSNYNYYTKWCLDLINEYVLMNPDIVWDGLPGSEAKTNRRLKEEFRIERDALRTQEIIGDIVAQTKGAE